MPKSGKYEWLPQRKVVDAKVYPTSERDNKTYFEFGPRKI